MKAKTVIPLTTLCLVLTGVAATVLLLVSRDEIEEQAPSAALPGPIQPTPEPPRAPRIPPVEDIEARPEPAPTVAAGPRPLMSPRRQAELEASDRRRLLRQIVWPERFKEVVVGMTEAEVLKIMKDSPTERHEGTWAYAFSYESFTKYEVKLLIYFANGRVTAKKSSRHQRGPTRVPRAPNRGGEPTF